MHVSFHKMHGLGNDFVLLDWRNTVPPILDDDYGKLALMLGDRHGAIGFDQMIILLPPIRDDCLTHILFFNHDGSSAHACGNGMRCVGDYLFKNQLNIKNNQFHATTLHGRLTLYNQHDEIAVDMGTPIFDWQQIPLSHEIDDGNQVAFDLPNHLEFDLTAVVLSMGNPHAVFYVDDADEVHIATLGPLLEHHPLFPQRANIGFVSPIELNLFRLRVWERGAGLTLACGTGACAAAIALIRLGHASRKATIGLQVDGALRYLKAGKPQPLWVRMDDKDGHVYLSGPSHYSYSGEIEVELNATR